MRSGIRKDNKPKYLYHLTSKDLGDSTKLIPFNVVGNDEPEIKRICCSVFPSRCFVAIPLDNNDLYMYRSKNKIKSYYPVDVKDSVVTKERWLFKPRSFEKIISIERDSKEIEKILKLIQNVHVGSYDCGSLIRAENAAQDIANLKFINRKIKK